MAISMKNFFTDNQVAFIGFSSNPNSFSRKVYNDFVKAGIKVYPVNSKKFSEDGLEIYTDIGQLPQVPECVYILLNKENTKKAVERLKGKGIKKILFHSADTVDESTLNECKKMGIEAVVACPRMFLSNGLIHRLHGFIAGVKR
ncbi:CoA-binding protein [Acetivibrio straminisolvens]|jgi:acyl-CoA synthetase (NDP forming)|uniref:CoA-binding domain protein n=1 Tax=Acetivibrio straminisolvens JCM 21531 TaxID=1294263 RepID=W4V0S7_9FIRM|nr:CoA-binding protein [Acetivibrio straminisolvens]GAE86697.1 CoA-binding domain protein [Acetivibrio straminisolvens JCM 21531]